MDDSDKQGPSKQRFFIALDPGAPELPGQLATLSTAENWCYFHKVANLPEAQASEHTIEVSVPLDARHMLCRFTRHGSVLMLRKIIFSPEEETGTAAEQKEGIFSRILTGLTHARTVLTVLTAVVTLGGVLAHLPWTIQIVRKADVSHETHAPAMTGQTRSAVPKPEAK